LGKSRIRREELTVRKEFEDMRLDRFISKAYSDLPKAASRNSSAREAFRVNGKKVQGKCRFAQGILSA
jgi:hypothetical protein